MANIFEGLEKFGFSNLEEVDIFQKEVKPEEDTSKIKKTITPEDCLWNKTYTCPVCDKEFTNKTIKSGKIRLISSDTDLRPYYEPIDPLFYDVVVCSKCGYAALTRFFSSIMQRHVDDIFKSVGINYKHVDYPELFTVDIAIDRYKLALYCALIKKSKAGEKAYICLKIGWLYRQKKDLQNELMFLDMAFKGFQDAYSSESFPICGLDQFTLTFLVAELARKLGNKELALRWASTIIVSKNASDRLKQRATDLKNMIVNESASHAKVDEKTVKKVIKNKK